MKCQLCDGENIESVPGKARDRPEIPILPCVSCGLVFLGSFSHVHESFYDTDYTDENHAERRFGQSRWRGVLTDAGVSTVASLADVPDASQGRCDTLIAWIDT